MEDREPLDVIELKIPAKADYVSVVRLFISGVANRIGFSYDDIEDVKVAIAEACTNVVTHAYPEGYGYIHIKCHVYGDGIGITVKDFGTSFDVQQVEQDVGPIDVKKPVQSLEEGGLGIHVMKALMDRVHIANDDGVAVKMVKLLQRNEVDADVHSATETPRSKQ